MLHFDPVGSIPSIDSASIIEFVLRVSQESRGTRDPRRWRKRLVVLRSPYLRYSPGYVGAQCPCVHTLQGSFSAVSKPNFASKYAFESSRRDLTMRSFAQLCSLNFLFKFCQNVW